MNAEEGGVGSQGVEPLACTSEGCRGTCKHPVVGSQQVEVGGETDQRYALSKLSQRRENRRRRNVFIDTRYYIYGNACTWLES